MYERIARLLGENSYNINNHQAIINIPKQESSFGNNHFYEDYYTILGVDRKASFSKIRSAYLKLAAIYHPDKNHAQETNSIFIKIKEAYDVLIDPVKRSHYDSNLLKKDSLENVLEYRSLAISFASTNLYQSSLDSNQALTIISLLVPLASSFGTSAFLVMSSIASEEYPTNNFSYLFFTLPAVNIVNLNLSSYTDSSFGMFSPAQGIQLALPSSGSNQEALDEKINFDNTKIPEEFICPLSMEIFTSPVHNPAKGLPNVEESWILQEILRTGKNPFNRELLCQKDLIPNLILKEKVDSYVELQINPNLSLRAEDDKTKDEGKATLTSGQNNSYLSGSEEAANSYRWCALI